jgi:hypothetical protein
MLFRWAPPEDPTPWQLELEQIAGPRSSRIPWLLLDWEPGATWGDEVVQRWLIYECVPIARLFGDPDLRSQLAAHQLVRALNGPSPASQRTWATRGGRWVMQSDSLVTQRQWELWRETGCYANPYWVLQGRRGGHKWRLNPHERRVLKAAGHLPELPPLGAWCYAPWDNRVREMLVRERELRERFLSLGRRDLETQTADDFNRRRKAQAVESGRALLKWLDRQLHVGASAATPKSMPDDMPSGPEVTDEAMEQAEQEYLDFFV